MLRSFKDQPCSTFGAEGRNPPSAAPRSIGHGAGREGNPNPGRATFQARERHSSFRIEPRGRTRPSSFAMVGTVGVLGSRGVSMAGAVAGCWSRLSIAPAK